MKLRLQFVLFIAIIGTFSIKAQVSDREPAARKWIFDHSKELNIQTFHNFKLTFVRKGLAGETLRFQQMLNDVPVYDNEIVINFVNGNEVAFSSNNYDDSVANISTIPAISFKKAIAASNEQLNTKSGKIINQKSKLVIYNAIKPTRLAYRITTQIDNNPGDWEVFVDAQNAEIISAKDISISHHKKDFNKLTSKKNTLRKKAAMPVSYVQGTAMVFDPDPLSKAHVAYAGNYVDNGDLTNAELDAARTAVVLPQIDFTSSVYRLKSQYVDIADFETPNKGLFTQATPDFSFTRDNDGFEAVNAFYHLDKSMRYINSTLGVTCAPSLNGGIFQFDPSGLNNADNSHYLPSTEQISFGEGCVDDAEDADVILHEFGHGIHDWITNGHASSATGLGEGNGDYWAVSYSRSLNQWLSSEAAYNWVFSWDGHNDCWSGRVTNYTRTYPQSGSTYTEIHTYGQIWATVLMKIYDVIGREKTDKAFLEGLALTGSSTTQPQAATAVRQAAINMNYPCADVQTMTTKFNAAGYNLAAVPLSMAVIANQSVTADSNNTYTLPSYATLANPISANCAATLTQSPITGTILNPGVYTITMIATLGTATVTRTFQLTVSPNLAVAQNVKENVVIYPNPAKNQITIKGEFDSNENITIYNLLGQKVIERNSISNEEKVDVSKLEAGVYTIYFTASKASFKFIKE
ncbi:T9SS type A sorting domain-containing protein [Flavobacterium sp. SUN052]|uniref:T9SS type A sorting domain-containing protein n=1 Tax=Flavobacterium sp. SUN052 TaxID=3002441 RepID=UPI00237DD3BA|nr:T9SS type A sorting domain-containing protein [Flavobacterium sp. SUN052]MEC4004701.1 T9SS type A sorting domain-containing protein [Flavobacterium sp. SUN052]